MKHSRTQWSAGVARPSTLVRTVVTYALLALVAVVPISTTRADGIPAPSVPYSADVAVEVAEGALEIVTWNDAGRLRQEIQQDGKKSIVIARPDMNAVYVYEAGEDTGMILPYDAAQHGGLSEMPDLDAEPEGEETINGVATTRYRFSGVNPFGEPMTGDAWISEAGVPMRVVTRAGDVTSTSETRSLEMGPVDPGLFEPPKDIEFRDVR